VKDPSAEAFKKWRDIINENDAAILESAICCNPDFFILEISISLKALL
jgi:hypothetical protein